MVTLDVLKGHVSVKYWAVRSQLQSLQFLLGYLRSSTWGHNSKKFLYRTSRDSVGSTDLLIPPGPVGSTGERCVVPRFGPSISSPCKLSWCYREQSACAILPEFLIWNPWSLTTSWSTGSSIFSKLNLLTFIQLIIYPATSTSVHYCRISCMTGYHWHTVDSYPRFL